GIDAATLRKAILPFYSTKAEGTGLGLAVAREVAQAHGGDLTVMQREGGGAVVRLTLGPT
ncbi:MAG: ATP-binding protein, partial [Myxococcales bacterium FL481]